MSRLPLPVDTILPDILRSLAHTPSLVIEAPPGAGKTTRVPPALLEHLPHDILVLEPRRIAARLAARRVAAELGQQVGETVGYQVRFEEAIGPRTRLRFLTEGILTRRLLSDPTLKNVSAVILDEFHERHLDSDLALAWLKRLQINRPDLHLLVMSATLDAAPIATFLNCPTIRSEGRHYPLTLRYTPYSADPLATQVRRAVEKLAAEGHTGNTLVFLPGLAEIRRAQRECDPIAQRLGLTILPLHGDLSPAEQDRVLDPSRAQKLILATNVAESSVTVEGVTAVIDSGLARIPSHSPWTGLPTLRIGRVSRASATQRAGRAGRTAPGQVIRLYPEEDFALRPEHDAPEITRADLSQLLLTLRATNLDPSQLDWLTPPPPESVTTAENLLDRLGATGPMAIRLASFPLPPRLARVLISALDNNVGEAGCRAAALLSLNARTPQQDILAALDQPPDDRLRQHTQQLLRLARPPKQTTHTDDALLQSLLAGFPDRVARRRENKRVTLANNLSAELAGDPTPYEFLLALDAEDREENPLPLIRLTARIEPEWLLDLFPNHIEDRTTVTWNRTAERVESVSALLYDHLLLAESRNQPPEAEAATLLAERALEAGLERFVDKESLDQLLARIAFAALPTPPIAETLAQICLGLRSFADLRNAAPNILALLEQTAGAQALNERAPQSLRLKNGRTTKIHYDPHNPPWIASRLQDFFGMTETPRIGPTRQPVVVHLLAPNHRAVQTTTDLAGFWQRLYPQVRRELMRRYPRHQWPETP